LTRGKTFSNLIDKCRMHEIEIEGK